VLAEGWRFQFHTPAFVVPYGPFGGGDAVPAGAAAIRSALEAAHRDADTRG
jgi:hypothetical protein